MPEDTEAGSIETTVPVEGQTADVGESASPTDTGELETGTDTVESPVTADAPEKGQASVLKELAKKFGWDDATAAEEAAKMAQGLEGKLGNWKDIEAKAQAYDRLEPVLNNPKMKEVLGQPEDEFDESQHTPQEIIDYRSDKRFEKLYQERVEPMVKDYYQRKATEAIDNVKAKYPDFEDYKPQVNEYLEKRPWLIGDEDTLVDIYKVLTYDKAKGDGGREAIEKLKGKKDISLGSQGSTAKTQPNKNMSIREALDSAWQ